MRDISRHLRITGRVQGVAYRAWTQAEAQAKGLTGWVRNEADGSVTALVQGPEEGVQAMITNCHSGPGAADVRDVQVDRAEAEAVEGFEIRR